MSDKLEEAIIGMLVTTSDISKEVKEAYGVDVCEGIIANVTNHFISM